MKRTIVLGNAVFFLTAQLSVASDFANAKRAILQQAGCFIVDYSFVETKSLKEGYVRDDRVYDTNSDKTTYELILPIQKSDSEIRLQHILFLKDLKTGQVQGLMKHHAEDWAFEAPHYFDFVSPGNWVTIPGKRSNNWTRKITNLDDGLRYQCEAAWDFSTFNPEWNCANFSPIPGRETRDMGRKDYNTLDRRTRLISYDGSWVERQDNTKTILLDGARGPLAQEHGRTWYVRKPESACAEAQAYAERQMPYWKVLMDVWEEYLSQIGGFREVPVVDGMPRFVAMMQVERQYASRLENNPTLLPEVKAKIREVIEAYRVK